MSTALRRAALTIAAGGGLAVLGILVGPAGSASADPVGIDLYAENGTTNLPGTGGAGTPVLGYCTSTPCTVTAPGGPTLRVAQGSTVTITLHNGLSSEATSLYVSGQAMVPDTTPVAADGSHSYAFTASRPGTYLYEAGVGAGSQHQVARGLFGALVVEPPTAGQAYDASTAFDAESVLVLSEVDSRLNRSASPATFDMRSFAPQWTLINGAAAPATAAVPVSSGQDVLLRWVNAGTAYHSMGVLGADQRVVALDGSQLKNGSVDISRRYVAETFGPGQTADAIVSVPATAADRKLAVYDASLTLHNNNSPGTGGMLTYLQVSGTGSGSDVSGPATRNVAWSGTALSASVDASAVTGATITGAEYFVDTVGAPGTGTAMEATDGAFGSATEAVRPTAASASTLATALGTGQHVVYVRGLSATAWGPFSSVLVTGSDAVGPTTSGVVVTPDHTNGSGSIAVSATGNDTTSGNSAIAKAEWAIDGGSATAMTLQTTGPVASVVGTIPTTTAVGLSEGTHTVTVRTQDVVGNWSDPVGVPLIADRTGPAVTSAVVVNPSPNNGTMPVNGTSATVRVSATITDPAVGADGTAQSIITAARGYLDGGATAIVMEAADGAFSGTTENVYLDIPLTTVKQLSDGGHSITVQGRDAAGNWGATATGTLVVDKTGPVISGLGLTPNPTNGATSVTLTGTATDVGSTVTRVEWFIGSGTPTAATVSPSGTFTATIPLGAYTEGDYTVTARGTDALGNRSTATAVLHLTPKLWFSTAGSTNPPGVTGTADDADIFHWTGSRFGRTADVSVAPYGLPSGANVDGFSRVDATHFYLSFTGPVGVPGLGTVQDEDVVYWNNGTWQLFFDGSINGNGLGGTTSTTSFDLDAVSVVGGRLYFSTDNANLPSGAGGTGDDSDIYRWNPGVTPRYSRMVDATTVGVQASANVDGLVWRSSSDYLFSFSANTTLLGFGSAQDEDVVRRTGTAWSTYFDGTAAGLTANNQDIDAFDIP